MTTRTPAPVDWGKRHQEASRYDLLKFLAESSAPDEPLPGTGQRHAAWWALQAINPGEGRLVMPVDFHTEERHPDGYVVPRWRSFGNQLLRDAVERGFIEIGHLEPVGDWFKVTTYPPSPDEDPQWDQIRWYHEEAIERKTPHSGYGCGAPNHRCRLTYRERGRRLHLTDAGYQRVVDRVPLSDGYVPYPLVHLIPAETR